MKDGDVWKMIFAPGFSTLEVVTDVSGRGVGMDVVMNNITALNGTVDIVSTEGQGMSVSFRVPLSVTVMEGLTSPGSDDMFQPVD
jgi:two-component system chemotaxis sensor kinase CheA